MDGKNSQLVYLFFLNVGLALVMIGATFFPFWKTKIQYLLISKLRKEKRKRIISQLISAACFREENCDITTKFRRLLHLGCKLLQVECGLFSIHSSLGVSIANSYGLHPEANEERLEQILRVLEKQCLGQGLEKMRNCFHIDYVSVSGWRDFHVFKDGPCESLIARTIPISKDQLGILFFFSKTARQIPFSEKDYALMSTISAWLEKFWKQEQAKYIEQNVKDATMAPELKVA